MISKELLRVLACPLCNNSVKLKGKQLVCSKCRVKYPIEDEIPNMLPPEQKD